MTDRELMQQVLGAVKGLIVVYKREDDNIGVCASCDAWSYEPHQEDCKLNNAINALRERLAQPEQEPESFERWNAKQHGDPEEIGFLQALRVAYCAGQDSMTAGMTRLAQPEQKPVAHTLNCICGAVWGVSPDGFKEMVHAPKPPQRTWVELTDAEIDQVSRSVSDVGYAYERALLAKLKEKNT